MRLKTAIFCAILGYLPGCISPSVTLNDIDVVFPRSGEQSVVNRTFTSIALDPKYETELRVVGEAIFNTPEPVRVDGVVAYFSGDHYYGGKTQEPEKFDKLKEGMTLMDIISLVGPGSHNKLEGIGFITWACQDGRILQVLPTSKLDEKAYYRISLHGTNQRHGDIRKLTKALIARLDIAGQKVAVILTEDTHQAKAGELKTYEIGQTFQKSESLPRIDFSITKIEGGSVHCYYFYKPPPDGLLHYTESGSLILQNSEQDGTRQSKNYK